MIKCIKLTFHQRGNKKGVKNIGHGDNGSLGVDGLSDWMIE